jgi:hypothetical protein
MCEVTKVLAPMIDILPHFCNNRSMELTLKAIIARCNGSREQAAEYCAFVASEHPRLRKEYAAYAQLLVPRETGIEKHFREQAASA